MAKLTPEDRKAIVAISSLCRRGPTPVVKPNKDADPEANVLRPAGAGHH